MIMMDITVCVVGAGPAGGERDRVAFAASAEVRCCTAGGMW